MAVIDHIKPLEHHSCGIPPQVMFHMKRLDKQSSKRMIDLAMSSYDKLVYLIEKALHGDVPVDSEERAAEYASHLILDAAFIHDCLCHAGCIVGAFPYDHLADRILPKPEQEQKVLQ
ncbi:MAG: hypothetical protein IJA20_02740 [Methanocorpusculum sp.]|nr:hypothetical protein [Methanocorpusculum sp.]